MPPKLFGHVSAGCSGKKGSQLTSHVQGEDNPCPDIVTSNGHRDRTFALSFTVDVLALVVLDQKLTMLDPNFENRHNMGAGWRSRNQHMATGLSEGHNVHIIYTANTHNS